VLFTVGVGEGNKPKVFFREDPDWNQLIEGRKEDIIWKIEEYLTSTQTLFPNLIYNQLHGEQYYFYPVEPELFEFPYVKTQ
jgi:hypothetical protein